MSDFHQNFIQNVFFIYGYLPPPPLFLFVSLGLKKGNKEKCIFSTTIPPPTPSKTHTTTASVSFAQLIVFCLSLCYSYNTRTEKHASSLPSYCEARHASQASQTSILTIRDETSSKTRPYRRPLYVCIYVSIACVCAF